MIATVFLVMYLLAHAFVAEILVTGMQLGPFATVIVAVILIVFGASPFVGRRLERLGHLRAARVFAVFGYTWAGLVVLFVLSRLTVDLATLLVAPVAPVARAFAPFGALILTAVCGSGLALYAFMERSRVRVETYTLPTSKWPDSGRDRVRVGQISDVHIGFMNGRRRIRAIAARLRAYEPDIVVSTGDLVDSPIGLHEAYADALAEIQPPLGKYAIIGNHEYYAGLPHTLAFLERAGFIVLRNAVRTVGGVQLVGVDDPATDMQADWAQRETRLLAQVRRDTFTVLLKHRPDLVKNAVVRADLQLSGHTHKGQIFPFNFLTRLYYPANAGLYRMARATFLYVSRGTGAWGPPFRLFSPPEITLFDIGPGLPDPGGRPLPSVLEDEVSSPAEDLPAQVIACSDD
ncbi:MAG: metallophosphoesterase [Gammaproteobacteria bacterium]|nr:metallophosphoesterase [Gammaproteobacteria bacterium]